MEIMFVGFKGMFWLRCSFGGGTDDLLVQLSVKGRVVRFLYLGMLLKTFSVQRVINLLSEITTDCLFFSAV